MSNTTRMKHTKIEPRLRRDRSTLLARELISLNLSSTDEKVYLLFRRVPPYLELLGHAESDGHGQSGSGIVRHQLRAELKSIAFKNVRK